MNPEQLANSPAFPRTSWEGGFDLAPGMTLRAYFAGQALAGLWAACADQNNIAHPRDMAAASVTAADALIAELAKPIAPGSPGE